MQQSKTSKVLQRTLLKSLLPFIHSNSDWQKWVCLLGRGSAVMFEKSNRKEKKPKCIVCALYFENYLLLVLHLELIHKVTHYSTQEHIEVLRYELAQETLLICTRPKQEIDLNCGSDFYHEVSTHEFSLKFTHKQRINQILGGIFGKFSRRQATHHKEYFHSLDVFRKVGAESEDEDSEAEVGQIQKQLQRMRISDFTDVNDNDKQFFLKWNDAVREAKLQNVYLSQPVLRDLLRTFAKRAKQDGIKRINLLMHAWTLWSTGRIEANDVTELLLEYDRAIVQ